jgi:protease-4
VASETIARQIRRAREAGKPVVVSMGNAAGSGGYWIAVEGSPIIAEPATLTGSIGVVAGKPNLEALWQRLGVRWDSVRADPDAGFGSIHRPYTEAERTRLSMVLDTLYADFKSTVAEARKLSPEAVEAAAKGRVWTGSEALRMGLVDRLGGYHEALAAIRETLDLPADAPLALEPFPPVRSRLWQIIDLLGGGSDGEGMEALLSALGRRLAALLLRETVPGFR